MVADYCYLFINFNSLCNIHANEKYKAFNLLSNICVRRGNRAISALRNYYKKALSATFNLANMFAPFRLGRYSGGNGRLL